MTNRTEIVQQLLNAGAHIDSKSMPEATLRGDTIELLLASENDSDFTIEERMEELSLRNPDRRSSTY